MADSRGVEVGSPRFGGAAGVKAGGAPGKK